MKNIKVLPHIWETRSLYQSANTPAQRALAGYIVKTGSTSNPICGAAFSMLRDIEYCKQRDIIYDLLFCVGPEEQKQIGWNAKRELVDRVTDLATLLATCLPSSSDTTFKLIVVVLVEFKAFVTFVISNIIFVLLFYKTKEFKYVFDNLGGKLLCLKRK